MECPKCTNEMTIKKTFKDKKWSRKYECLFCGATKRVPVFNPTRRYK